MLRIIAGRYRGRRLQTPPGLEVRPTGDRVKETLYNVVQDLVRGACVLDLYAGTGNLGLEAASRGARRVVCVERSPAAWRVLQRNVEFLGARDVEMVREDALRYLGRPQPEPFDLILADPPYEAGSEDALLSAVGSPVLRPGGVFVLQHRRTWQAPEVASSLRRWQSKRFGDTGLDFFVREEEGHAEADGARTGNV